MSIDPLKLIRPNIAALVPYASARDEYKGKEGVFLDANEHPVDSGLNRYPDPYQNEVKELFGALRGIDPAKILFGNGSDEVIDLIFRAFCIPGKDNIIVLPPTYGMYKVSAGINDVEVREVLLNEQFQPEVSEILAKADSNSKVLFICSPNNPSGNVIFGDRILQLIREFPGIVVVDEAYIDFCPDQSMVPALDRFPNLIIMQTLSKAWGLAGIRMGIMMASPQIIAVMNKIKPPYNINIMTQRIALEALKKVEHKNKTIQEVLVQREWLKMELLQLTGVEMVYPSDANFLLVRFTDPKKVFAYLIAHKIIVRDRSTQPRCEGALRITIGTAAENIALIEVLKTIEN
jgi:histidinol-phosphate aminotransferase